MSTDNLSNIDESMYIGMSESQTLDSLLQSACDTPSQSDTNEINTNIESKPEKESFRKRSHSESMNIYINTLKPKDVVIFIEDIKYFTNSTVFMNEFRTSFIDPILKYLNGGDPLKNDFGRDPHTSAYSLFTYSLPNTSIKDTCRDTVRIIRIMEALDNMKFTERNLNKAKISIKTILEKSKEEFLYFDEYRNNHPKRKRYLIFIFHSDLCLDGISDIVNDLSAMKVRFSAFGVYKHDACIDLCEALNYNKKGQQDLSCFGLSDRWPITLSNGLYKYFESSKSNEARNKNFKFTNSREQMESNEFEFINFMNSNAHSESSLQSISGNSVSENQINSSINTRPIMASNDTIDNSLMITNQNVLQHNNLQSKYVATSSSNYYHNASPQSEISKSNQMPFFPSPDPFYPTSSSVNITSHRPTSSSLLLSQSSQFHSQNPHAAIPQTVLYNDQMKPNSNAEHSNEIISPMSNLSNQMSITKPNQDIDIVPSLHRHPTNSIPFNTNNPTINPTNFNQNRFLNRPSYFPTNQIRNNTTILFEGVMQYDDSSTDLHILIDQAININLLNMHTWEKQCSVHYVHYFEGYHLPLYGKSNGDIDINNIDGSMKGSPIEVQVKMNQTATESIIANLSSKPNSMIAIIKPFRPIPAEIHIQCVCILLNRNPSGIKFLIPADPRNLLNDIRNRMQSNSYPVGQSNPMYNQIKRNNFVTNNQPMYAIPPSISLQRPMINRYSSHPGNNIPMLSVAGSQNYRTISHPAGFLNNQQMSPNPNYILHSNQYAANPNQPPTSSYPLSMEMNMQPSQNIYDQNPYI